MDSQRVADYDKGVGNRRDWLFGESPGKVEQTLPATFSALGHAVDEAIQPDREC